jgi:heptosyltransferase-3
MRSVLVVVTRQIGDVLLTTPLVRAVRQRWPQARIDVLGIEGTLGMLAGNPDVNETIAMPARPRLADVMHLARTIWRRYDLALVADPGDRAHLLGWLAARQRCGLLPRENRSNWWKRGLLRHAVTQAGDLGGEHVVVEKLRLLEPWVDGTHPAAAPALVAPVGADLPLGMQQRLRPGYVVVHAPSMWAYKQWPLPHFRELVARLVQAGHQVVLTGGPGAGDRAAVEAMRGAVPDDRLVDAGLLNFNQVAGLLRGAALYIGPDTSVSHLAAACATPVLAIFGPTNPQRWAPWAGSGCEQPVVFRRQALQQTVGHVTVLQAQLPCVPCGRAGCDDHRDSRTECLPAITPERVAQEALRLLREGATTPSLSSRA